MSANTLISLLVPLELAGTFKVITTFGLGGSISGVTGGITVVGSNDGKLAIATFFWIFGLVFVIDFGVIEALIGIAAFGS